VIWIGTCEVAIFDKIAFCVATAKSDILVMAHCMKRLLHGVRNGPRDGRVGLTLMTMALTRGSFKIRVNVLILRSYKSVNIHKSDYIFDNFYSAKTIYRCVTSR
jgi:hypothetical protein